jgi:hypothetical protein
LAVALSRRASRACCWALSIAHLWTHAADKHEVPSKKTKPSAAPLLGLGPARDGPGPGAATEGRPGGGLVLEYERALVGLGGGDRPAHAYLLAHFL